MSCDLPFNFEEYIENRELIVSGFEKLASKHRNKRVSRGTTSVAKGAVNTAGGGAAVTAASASVIATNAAATAATTSCAVTAASAASTAVTAAAAASVAAVAAPVVLGVGMAMGLGMCAGKYIVDRADEAEFSRLAKSLGDLNEMDRIIDGKITEIQEVALAGKESSEASPQQILLNSYNAWNGVDAAAEIKEEVVEGFDAMKAVGDGHCNASDLELVNQAVGDGTLLAAEGTAAAVTVAGGLGIFGVLGGIWDMHSGAKKIQNEDDFEKKLAEFAKVLRAQCVLIRKYEACFSRKGEKCGRLTYINGGGGCARDMLVSYLTAKNESVEVISDESHVVVLPEGARSISVRFSVQGGSMAWKVNRHDPKQPWIVPSEEEEINIRNADGVNAVFELRGTSQHSYMHEAWDFGKNSKSNSSREYWEWCGDEKALLLSATCFWVQSVHKWVTNTCRNITATNSSKGAVKCGRLTYINGGGGCSRTMQVSYRTVEKKMIAVDSDSSHFVILPKDAYEIKIRFKVFWGSMAWRVDRKHPRQPWKEPYEVEVIEIPHADGIDAVFELRGTSKHSYVHKAWNFGTGASSARYDWEWSGETQDQEKLFSLATNIWVKSVRV